MRAQAYDIKQETGILAEFGPLKTWSVVITILGDLAPRPGDRINGRTLAALVDPMGITNQALRVAVHRLRKDGWIDSVKDGRESLYRLTAMGRAERDRAALRIYGRATPPLAGATLVIAPPDRADALSGLISGGAVLLTPRTVLTDCPPKEIGPENLCLRLTKGAVPDWVRSLLADDMLCAEFERLSTCVDRILCAPHPSDTLHRTVLRLLVLHHWRRLLLRHGPLAEAVLPDDWAGARARAKVMAALDQLPAPTLKALADAVQDQPRKA